VPEAGAGAEGHDLLGPIEAFYAQAVTALQRVHGVAPGTNTWRMREPTFAIAELIDRAGMARGSKSAAFWRSVANPDGNQGFVGPNEDPAVGNRR
jgi:hypothetical protein